MGQAVAMLADGMTKAASRLVGLVDAQDEKIALAACKAVLELGMRLRQAEETECRAEDLTRLVIVILAADRFESQLIPRANMSRIFLNSECRCRFHAQMLGRFESKCV